MSVGTTLAAWIEPLAVVSLAVAAACVAVIIADLLAGHAQHMWIMNLVWPITALYFGPLALWAYFTWGRLATRRRVTEARRRGEEPPARRRPLWQACSIGATHCGSGCAVGDVIAEWSLFFFPVMLFGMTLFAGWAIAYVLAFLFGIGFQYFTIKPMKDVSVTRALVMAIKADTLSLTAWQVGMYGWMAVATFVVFGREIPQATPAFWFMMQIAMVCGFVTAYPVNWWLLQRGLKERM
jgi:hypothetical protein